VLQTLNTGDKVLMAFNYAASSAPDVDPGARALFQYCMQKGLKIITVAFAPQGDMMAEDIISLWEAKGKKYGEDFINLGYVAGMESGIAAVAKDIYSIGRDVRRNPLDPVRYPILSGLKTAADFKISVAINTGNPGAEEWIRQIVEPYKLKFLLVQLTIGAPRAMPYVQSGQISGIVIGLRGGAELEQLMKLPGKASAAMDMQSLGHFAILAFMVLGNIAFFFDRRQRALAKEAKQAEGKVTD
jgi:hypothetical protein